MIGRRTLLATAAAVPLSLPFSAAAARPAVWWKEGPVLTQNIDNCEAFALVGAWAAATQVPITAKQGNKLARYIYRTAWEQVPPHTSGVGQEQLLQVAKQLGMVTTWVWPQTVSEMLDCLPYAPMPVFVKASRRWSDTNGPIAHHGPGPWDAHAVVVTAYRRGQIRLRNSWSRHWGRNGSAWMSVDDLRTMWGSRRHYGYYRDAYLAAWDMPSSPARIIPGA